MQPLTNIAGQSVGIIGFGMRTGVSLARFLAVRGAKITLFDRQSPTALAENLQVLQASDEWREAGDRTQLRTAFASDDYDWVADCTLLIASPGVGLEQPVFERARQLGKRVVGELEFSSWFVEAPMIAVSGTNGKTTVCELIAQMLRNAGENVFLGGNYGNPLVNAIGGNYNYIVAEVSSFQLETIESFHPRIAVLLNISEDHLDRHGSLAAYAALKGRLFSNQQTPPQSHDWAVICGDDPLVMETAAAYPVRKLCYSHQPESHCSVRVMEDRLAMDLAYAGGDKLTVSLGALPLPGAHNRDNIAAVLAVGALLGVDAETLQTTVDNAALPRHRLEVVHRRDGVTFINDSKSTTVDSTLKALAACRELGPVLVILGGKEKGINLRPLNEGLADGVKMVAAYGEIAPRLRGDLQFPGPFAVASSFDEAVRATMAAATRGDVVLLSPAASSLDQFRNFEERGDRFGALVRGEAS